MDIEVSREGCGLVFVGRLMTKGEGVINGDLMSRNIRNPRLRWSSNENMMEPYPKVQ